MSPEVEFLPINNDRLIFVALVASTIAILNDKAIPIREELVLRTICPEHVVVVIRVTPVV